MGRRGKVEPSEDERSVASAQDLYTVKGGTDDETSTEEEEQKLGLKKTLRQKILERKFLTLVIVVVYSGYGIMSVVFDWIWVYDVLRVEKALVFGPPPAYVTAMIIVVSVIGTISYMGEIVNLVEKIKYKNEMLEEDKAQVLSLFFEEIPKTTLNLLLASCREVPLSVFQLVMAAWTMIGACLRCLRTLVKWIFARKRGKKRGLLPFAVRLVIFGACFYTAVGSVMVWVFTFTTPPDDGGEFRPPDSILSKSYDKARYFYKSGVYFNHPMFAACNDPSVTPHNKSGISWVKLESLFTIEEATGSTDMWMMYNDTVSFLGVQTNQYEMCYATNFTDCSTELVSTDTCYSAINMTIITFKFLHSEISRTLVFGDIKYNASITDEDGCHYLHADDSGNLYHMTDRSGHVGELHYFRVNADVNDTYSFFQDEETGDFQFYWYDVHLNDVAYAWKTGYNKCDMSGALSPNPSDEIPLEC